jgi:hypothetical protein
MEPPLLFSDIQRLLLLVAVDFAVFVVDDRSESDEAREEEELRMEDVPPRPRFVQTNIFGEGKAGEEMSLEEGKMCLRCC